MDNQNNAVNVCLVPITSYCLSPEDTNASPERENPEPDPATAVVYEKYADTDMTLSSLDLQTFILPPTPEGSELGHDIAFLLEDIFAESNAADNLATNTSVLHCPADKDMPLPVDANLKPLVDKMLSSHPCSQTMQSDELTDVLLNTLNSQNQTLLTKQIIESHLTDSLSENNVHHINENTDQGEPRVDLAKGDSLEETWDAIVATTTTKSSEISVNGLNSKSKLKNKANNSLKFPPCVICRGKATGSHYGAITCEACKGFFRRYLQKKKEFKCTKGGKCEILCSNKGNCSGCRLKKCLALGMSKEMTRLGRYTLTKRTELIINMKRLEGNAANDSVIWGNDAHPEETGIDANSCNQETDLITRHLLQNTKTSNMSNGFDDTLVAELVQALDDLEPYGPDVKTKEQISELHKHHFKRYKRKIELFGKMNSVPKDEYNRLYKEFGIDIDGRMADMKIEFEDLEEDLEGCCDFAKHIPGFYILPKQDQSNLLKALGNDFFTIAMIDSYSDEYRTFLSKNGRGYHYDELADREFSGRLLTLIKEIYCRWQKLNLNKEETALIAALTLVSSDRCKLENRTLVEKIQLALADLLHQQIKKKGKCSARGRFTKIIDSLTFMRDMSELFTKEYNSLCKDDVVIQQFPFIVDFIVEETY